MTIPLQEYIEGLLGEEAGEINQELGKARRFGMDTPSPVGSRYKGTTPRQRLTLECGDMLAAIMFAIETGLINAEEVNAQGEKKLKLHRDPAFREMAFIPEEMKVDPYAGRCREGDRCVCGASIRIRAGCGNWVNE